MNQNEIKPYRQLRKIKVDLV